MSNHETKPLWLEINLAGVVRPGLPSDNMIGTILLSKFLGECFLKAGLDCRVDGAGELNRAALRIFTSQVPETLETLQTALAAVGLHQAARVYLRESDELEFRCLFPEDGAPVAADVFLPSFARRLQASVDFVKAGEAFFKKHQG